jgi:hypothetical protein
VIRCALAIFHATNGLFDDAIGGLLMRLCVGTSSL